MTTLRNPQTYDEAILELAEAHADGAPDDLRIYHFPDVPGQAVRFVEVSASHPSEDEDTQVAPAFHFMPAKSFAYHSVVVLLSERDWVRVLGGGLRLPEGWELSDKQQVWPR